MNFYSIDPALQEAVTAAEKPVRLQIEIHVGSHTMNVFEEDIIEAYFFGLKEKSGGVSSRGEVLLANSHGAYNFDESRLGIPLKVSFSVADDLPYFHRFNFFLDDKGVQDIRGPGRERYIRLVLRDLSYKLRKSNDSNDWTSPAVFAYSVICDKSQPHKSLVHGIAQRAGLSTSDIDCSTIPITLPYVQLKRNIWAELSSLATAYRCHLECPVEKPLVFAHSPYQSEPPADSGYSYTFTGENIFHFHKIAREELYRNSVRLKINMPVSLERQEIWRYDDSPVFYDEFLQSHYPFRYPLVRNIEAFDYEAKYRITDANGKDHNVIYADQIDTLEEAENRLDYDGGPFSWFQYDTTSSHDKAILKLHKTNDGDLYHASIHGRPIILDLNRSYFCRDDGEINLYGTAALNITGSYFSDYEISSRRHYEDWAIRELAERTQQRREFVVKTHKALFFARIGSMVKIALNDKHLGGTINAFSFRFRKNKAFVAAFRILEGGKNEE